MATGASVELYISPERCTEDECSALDDIWAVGLIAYRMASGRYPFGDLSSFTAMYEQLCEMPEPRLEESAGFSPALCCFVASGLTRDLSGRMDGATLLKH